MNTKGGVTKKNYINDKNDRKNSNEKKCSEKYNEGDIIKRFLCSEEGITFLVDRAKEFKREKELTGIKVGKDIESQIDDLIDFYISWAINFPIRRSNKVTKYELLKHIEDYCSKGDIEKFFAFLFY